MKNGVLVCLGSARTKNIGDYIQSVAARQFAGRNAVSVEREELDRYSGDHVRLIMNGWFMHHSKRFPPVDEIEPLFVSFHVKPRIAKSFFTDRTVAYLKLHEPIGCRSTEAVEMLQRHGIRAEYTSCLTLTLGETYHHVSADTPPVFVDPYVRPLRKKGKSIAAIWQIVSRIAFAITHLSVLRKLAPRIRACYRHLPGMRFLPVRWYYLAEFYRVYSSAFSDDLLLSAEYLSHGVDRNADTSNESLFAVADELLKRYEKAPFVVTSRLHCALPCIAIGTPVWVPYCPAMTFGRFGGNLDFMNILTFDGNGRCIPPPGGKISRLSMPPPVRNEFRPFAESLSRRCRDFMGSVS